jgi:hypothetical protein
LPAPLPTRPPQWIRNYFTGSGNALGRSLAGLYKTCSFGQVSVLPSNVRVMGPYNIPCTGSVDPKYQFASGNNFDTRSCNNDNMLKWQYYVDSLALRDGVNPLDYNHKILVLPKGFGSSVQGALR